MGRPTAPKRAALSTYDSKRDFSRTAEPRGALGRAKGRSYAIQKHAARRLHFDLRLELDGVLKSWAVTRGPSLDPKEKRLAVRTEDHPLEYGAFEGTIPTGQYGGGTVILWDRGTWTPKGDPHEGLANGMLKFEIEGERLRGGFALVRMKPRRKETRENWLLVKERDESADPGTDPIAEWETSVTTGRSMEAVSAGKAPALNRARARGKRVGAAKPANLPAFTAPQLASATEAPPTGEDWLHEIKYDGYRVIASVDGDAVRLFTRAGNDWTEQFASIAGALRKLGLKACLLDGEAVVLDERGRSRFGALQKALESGNGDFSYFVFDILVEDGRDLKRLPLSERKQRVAKVIRRGAPRIQVSKHIAGSGADVLARACELGIEGIVSKRADGRYVPGRSKSWLKSKCSGRDEFVIGGYRVSSKKGRTFASLLVGEFEGEELLYRGRVGTGFDEKGLDDLGLRLRELSRAKSPFAETPTEARHGARWVEPRLIAEIAYAERTAGGVLRHARFLGLREDKVANEVQHAPAKPKKGGSGRSPPGGGVGAGPRNAKRFSSIPSAVRLTHPEKVLFPAANLTKQALADYFAAVSEVMLPHIAKRPLSLVRCPDGAGGSCFFQKHLTPGMPRDIRSVAVKESDGERTRYMMMDSEAGLVSAAQIGGLEIHIWGSRSPRLKKPDRLVFDLDPDPSVPFAEVRRAAFDLRDVLGAAGLITFPLLTGGKGVHVVAPLDASQDWDEVKAFAKGLATRLASDDPTRFIATMSKAKRRGRIFIDWMRNERGSTAIAPYSPRAKDNASVAAPVSWRELARAERADAFTMATVLRRVRGRADPWSGYFETRQNIPAAALRAIGSARAG